jgi:hypothetical protein
MVGMMIEVFRGLNTYRVLFEMKLNLGTDSKNSKH